MESKRVEDLKEIVRVYPDDFGGKKNFYFLYTEIVINWFFFPLVIILLLSLIRLVEIIKYYGSLILSQQ